MYICLAEFVIGGLATVCLHRQRTAYKRRRAIRSRMGKPDPDGWQPFTRYPE